MINPILSSWQYFITLHGCLHIHNKSQVNPDIAFFLFRLKEIVAWPQKNIVMIWPISGASRETLPPLRPSPVPGTVKKNKLKTKLRDQDMVTPTVLVPL